MFRRDFDRVWKALATDGYNMATMTTIVSEELGCQCNGEVKTPAIDRHRGAPIRGVASISWNTMAYDIGGVCDWQRSYKRGPEDDILGGDS